MNKVWKIHPVAKEFPKIGGEQFAELKADIAKNGIRLPILVNSKRDTVLDGRNRLMAAHDLKLADKDVPIEVFDGTEDEAVAQIISRNIHRRHLTDEQRVSLVVKLLGPQLTKEAEARERAGKADLTLKSTQGRTHEKIATVAKVGTHKARAALETAKHSPQDLDDVIEGKAKLAAAHKKIKARARSTKPKTIKPLPERVETRFVRFMETFAVADYVTVRSILREILAKIME